MIFISWVVGTRSCVLYGSFAGGWRVICRGGETRIGFGGWISTEKDWSEDLITAPAFVTCTLNVCCPPADIAEAYLSRYNFRRGAKYDSGSGKSFVDEK